MNKMEESDVHLTDLPHDMWLVILSYCDPPDARNLFITSKYIYSMCGDRFWSDLFKIHYNYKLKILKDNKLDQDIPIKMKFLNWSKINKINLFTENNAINIEHYKMNTLKYFEPLSYEIISLMNIHIINHMCTQYKYLSTTYNIYEHFINQTLNIKDEVYKTRLLKYLFTVYDRKINVKTCMIIIHSKYLQLFLDTYKNIDNIWGIDNSFSNVTYTQIISTSSNTSVPMDNMKILLTHKNIPDKLKEKNIKHIVSNYNSGNINILFAIYDKEFIINLILSYAYDIDDTCLPIIINKMKSIYDDDMLIKIFKHNIGHFIRSGLYILIKDLNYELSADELLSHFFGFIIILYTNNMDGTRDKSFIHEMIMTKMSLTEKIKFLENDNILPNNIIHIFLNDPFLKYDYNKNKASVLCGKALSFFISKNLNILHIDDKNKTIQKLKEIITTLTSKNKKYVLRSIIIYGNYHYLDILLSVHTFEKEFIYKNVSHCIHKIYTTKDNYSPFIFNNERHHLYILLNKLIRTYDLNTKLRFDPNMRKYNIKSLLDSVVIKINDLDNVIMLCNLYAPITQLRNTLSRGNYKLVYNDKILDETKSLSYHIKINSNEQKISTRNDPTKLGITIQQKYINV